MSKDQYALQTLPHALPWEEMMRFAFGVLHWTPQTFWQSSLREFGAAINAYHAPHISPMDHNALQNLMHAFPDE